MSDMGRGFDGSRQVFVELSDKELLSYVVERATDQVNRDAKAREEGRLKYIGIALTIFGLAGFGWVTKSIGDAVEEQFEAFTASVDTIRRDVEAGAAMTTLNTDRATLASLSADDDAVRSLTSAIASSERMAQSSLVPWAVLPLLGHLGPTESWDVIHEVDDHLGEALRANEWTCSVMARNHGVYVVGSGIADGLDRLEPYLDCLRARGRQGEYLFWQLLVAFRDGKNNPTDSTNVLKSRLDELPAAQYRLFVDLFCALANPDNEEMADDCYSMRSGFGVGATDWSDDAFEVAPDLDAMGAGYREEPYGPDAGGAIWTGSAGKRVQTTLDSLASKYPDLLSDPLEREVRAFAAETGRIGVGATVEGTLSAGESTRLDDKLTDRWILGAEEGLHLVVEASADWDTFIYVRDPAGRVGENDDHSGLDSACQIESTTGGEYSILVHDRFNYGGGPYRLTVRAFVAGDEDGYYASCLQRY